LEGPNSGRIDLATAEGKERFRIAVAGAAAQSDHASERIRPALAAMAADGYILAGGRLFGFELLNESDVPDGVTAVQRPAEVAVIREVASRMLAGERLAHLAAELNERGITTTRGGRWTGANLGRMIGHPQYGGHIELHGKRVGRIKGELVLEETVFNDVQATLASRRRGRRPTGLWPLTGIMHCGNPKCDPNRTLAGYRSAKARADGTKPRRYVCAAGNGGCGLSIRADETEKIVTARVLAEGADEDLAAKLNAETVALNEAREAAAAEVERLIERLGNLEVKWAEERIREDAYDRAKAVLDRRIGKAEAELKQLQTAAEDARSAPAITEAEWEAMTPAEKRSWIKRLRLTITITPAQEGAPRNVFDPDRVNIDPRF
jgi:hypothetical protein